MPPTEYEQHDKAKEDLCFISIKKVFSFIKKKNIALNS